MSASVRVIVLYNAPTLPIGHPDHESEADVVAVAGHVAQLLRQSGCTVELVAAGPPLASLVERLTAGPIDVVFNLVEGFGGQSGGEAHVTGLLELLGLPYTGSPPGAMVLGLAKERTKTMLRGAGLPTARSVVARRGEAIPTWSGPWPVIVKPEAEDASLGIDQGSVAGSPEALGEAVARLRRLHRGDVQIEAYLPGREFNVGVLALPEAEPEALPIAEIVYDMPPGTWPILTYDAKWATGSAADRASVPRCPAEIPSDLAAELGRLAVAAFRAVGCRDYGRVDCRLDASGRPMILEVNPNPDIGPTAGWARALRASGRDYGITLREMVDQARNRGGPGPREATR